MRKFTVITTNKGKAKDVIKNVKARTYAEALKNIDPTNLHHVLVVNEWETRSKYFKVVNNEFTKGETLSKW